MFRLAGGSIPGTEHTQRGDILLGKNNQDAFSIYESPEVTIALVADGCGGQAHSEVGSKLGIALLNTALEAGWKRCSDESVPFEERLRNALEYARVQSTEAINGLARSLLPCFGAAGGRASYSEIVCDYFLFTIVGALIAHDKIGFFSLGDGVIVINGDVTQIGPFPKNEPPYLCYGLLKTRFSPEELIFQIHRCLDIADVETFLLGSDGVADLAGKSEVSIPGCDELIGPLSQFWEEERYLSRSGIRKRLTRIQSRRLNYNGASLVVEDGRLPDDTTMIVGRRLIQGAIQ